MVNKIPKLFDENISELNSFALGLLEQIRSTFNVKPRLSLEYSK